MLEKCTLSPLSKEMLESCDAFDCDHNDLNDFFANDAIHYSDELLGKTYCFTLDENPKVIVCAFTVSNDSIKINRLPNNRGKKVAKEIPRQKRMRSYPAVLIGRLGVRKDFRSIEGEQKSTGDQLMDFIKSWFISPKNKTGCRFVVVDSYNEPRALGYYKRNNFVEMFSSDDQEKEYLKMDAEEALHTRILFFDLIVLKRTA